MVNSGLDIASSLVSIHCPILYCGYFVAIFASLQLLGSNVAVNADGFAAGFFGSLDVTVPHVRLLVPLTTKDSRNANRTAP